MGTVKGSDGVFNGRGNRLRSVFIRLVSLLDGVLWYQDGAWTWQHANCKWLMCALLSSHCVRDMFYVLLFILYYIVYLNIRFCVFKLRVLLLVTHSPENVLALFTSVNHRYAAF